MRTEKSRKLQAPIYENDIKFREGGEEISAILT
jgi:hypothetical protein